MGQDVEIAYQHRFVADAGTARAMARAFVGHLLRSRAVWTLLGVAFVLFAVLMYVGFDDRYAVTVRIVAAAMYALVPSALFLGLMAAIALVRTRRNAEKRLFDGALLRTGFGDDAFVVETPLSSGRTAYALISSVTSRGDFTFVRFAGNPTVSVFPRELFPDDAVARIEGAAHP